MRRPAIRSTSLRLAEAMRTGVTPRYRGGNGHTRSGRRAASAWRGWNSLRPDSTDHPDHGLRRGRPATKPRLAPGELHRHRRRAQVQSLRGRSDRAKPLQLGQHRQSAHFQHISEQENARKILTKRFGNANLQDAKTQRRAVAMLQRRGFSSKVIFDLLKYRIDED